MPRELTGLQRTADDSCVFPVNFSHSVNQFQKVSHAADLIVAVDVEPQDHRRLTPTEMARLQGFQNGDIAWKAAGTPKTAKGHQVGNAMSVPVLQEAIRAVLSAAGLI